MWKDAENLYKSSITLDDKSARTQRNYAIFHTYKGLAEEDNEQKVLWEKADEHYKKASISDS